MFSAVRIRYAIAGISVALWVVGCSPDVTTVEVSGHVTLKGAPVPGGTIRFFPHSGRFVGAAINADGTFSVRLAPGDYNVAIKESANVPPDWKFGDPVPEAKATLPPRLANAKSSGLTAHIGKENPDQTMDFELSKK